MTSPAGSPRSCGFRSSTYDRWQVTDFRSTNFHGATEKPEILRKGDQAEDLLCPGSAGGPCGPAGRHGITQRRCGARPPSRHAATHRLVNRRPASQQAPPHPLTWKTCWKMAKALPPATTSGRPARLCSRQRRVTTTRRSATSVNCWSRMVSAQQHYQPRPRDERLMVRMGPSGRAIVEPDAFILAWRQIVTGLGRCRASISSSCGPFIPGRCVARRELARQCLR